MTDLLKGFAKATVPEHVVPFAQLPQDVQDLLQAAIVVRQRAYVPYSGFKVGAAFRSTDGTIYTGCNVENAAFSSTSCAERTALTKAVSEGAREFSVGAVVAYQADVFTPPCGVCRQFIREFASTDIPIYVAQAHDACDSTEVIALRPEELVLCTTIFNLLPNSFHKYK